MNLLEYLASIEFNDPVIISLFLIIVMGVGLQWIAQLRKIPGIVLLLPAGMFFGAYLGLIEPKEIFGSSFYTLVSLGVGFLLFSGGLNLNLSKLRKKERNVIKKIIPVNTILTFIIGGIIIKYLFSMNILDAFLIAALLIVSGPTVVGPILEYSKPNKKLNTTAKWEAIITDPLGAIIAVIVLYIIIIVHAPNELLYSTNSPFNSVTNVFLQHTIFQSLDLKNFLLNDLFLTAILGTIIGILVGVVFAILYVKGQKKGLITDKFHILVLWMLVSAAILIGEILFPEAGLFAALTIGVVVANIQTGKETFLTIHLNDFIEPIIIGVLFMTLASLVDINHLMEYLIPSLILIAIYVLIIRPLVTFIATYNSKFTFKEKIFLGFIHPRGIVAAASASLFALKLNNCGLNIPQLIPVVFIVILGTVIIYGIFNPILTRKLGLSQQKCYEDTYPKEDKF